MATPIDPLPPDVRAAFERRQPIEAIKLLLAARATPRGTAKAAVDRPARADDVDADDVPPRTHSNPPAVPSSRASHLAPGEVPRADSAFWGWVVAGLFAYLAYRWVRG